MKFWKICKIAIAGMACLGWVAFLLLEMIPFMVSVDLSDAKTLTVVLLWVFGLLILTGVFATLVTNFFYE